MDNPTLVPSQTHTHTQKCAMQKVHPKSNQPKIQCKNPRLDPVVLRRRGVPVERARQRQLGGRRLQLAVRDRRLRLVPSAERTLP